MYYLLICLIHGILASDNNLNKMYDIVGAPILRCDVGRPRNKGQLKAPPNTQFPCIFRFLFFPRVSKGNNTHPRVSWASATPASSVPLYILCYPLQVVLELITYYKSYHGMTLCLAYNLPGSDLFSLGLRSAL